MKKKKRQFVRPNCDKVWYFQCNVCLKKHYKFASHNKCFRRWCQICQDTFTTEGAMRDHALKYHKKEFCKPCNQVIANIKKHKLNFH